MNPILLKQKPFIEQVVADNLRPDSSNDNVKEILEAYHEIDPTAEVLIGCTTCTNMYKEPFKLILAYINAPVIAEVKPIVKAKK